MSDVDIEHIIMHELGHVLGLTDDKDQDSSSLPEPVADQAIYHLRRSLKGYNDKNIYISLGNAYWTLEDYDKAEKNFLIVTSMFPQMLAPHFWLATLYYDIGRFNDCITQLKHIIDAQPKIMSDEVRAIKNDAFLLLEGIIAH